MKPLLHGSQAYHTHSSRLPSPLLSDATSHSFKNQSTLVISVWVKVTHVENNPSVKEASVQLRVLTHTLHTMLMMEKRAHTESPSCFTQGLAFLSLPDKSTNHTAGEKRSPGFGNSIEHQSRDLRKNRRFPSIPN